MHVHTFTDLGGMQRVTEIEEFCDPCATEPLDLYLDRFEHGMAQAMTEDLSTGRHAGQPYPLGDSVPAPYEARHAAPEYLAGQGAWYTPVPGSASQRAVVVERTADGRYYLAVTLSSGLAVKLVANAGQLRPRRM